LVNLVEHSAENRALLVALKVPMPQAADAAATDDSGAEQQSVPGDNTGAVSAICKVEKLACMAAAAPSALAAAARACPSRCQTISTCREQTCWRVGCMSHQFAHLACKRTGSYGGLLFATPFAALRYLPAREQAANSCRLIGAAYC